MTSLISIVQYGSANIGSICNMLKKLSIPYQIIDNPTQLTQSNKVILPGVGSFDNGITSLKESGLVEPLRDYVANPDNYLLGICLGMQLLGNASEEGRLPGLGLIPGRCIKFKPSSSSSFKVPHMCWNYINPKDSLHPLLRSLPKPEKFYFVHSYHFICESKNHELASTIYNIPFTSVIGSDNCYGCQFHPEKSHKYGLKLLSNFAEI